MATLVSVWSSKLGHITDGPNDETVKTRCGRTLKMFHYGQGGTEDCPRCGSIADYETVRNEMHQAFLKKEKQEQEKREALKNQQEQRLSTHRRLMSEFREMLDQAGATITEVREAPAGGSIEFSINGLKFQLGGNIW